MIATLLTCSVSYGQGTGMLITPEGNSSYQIGGQDPYELGEVNRKRKQEKEAKRIAKEEKVYLKKKAIEEKANRELMARKQKCISYGFKDKTDGMGMCLIELDKLDVLKEESANNQQRDADERLKAKRKADGQATADARVKADAQAKAKANEVALEQRRADIKRQNNQADWGRLAGAIGKTLTAPGAFGNPQPTRICNFKSWDGAIISGDCSRLTINIGSDTYWKL